MTVAYKCIVCNFATNPIHTYNLVYYHYGNRMPWNFPIFDFKEYFGEKIALHTLFVGHYSNYLIIPSIIGVVFQLVVWGTINFSSPVLPFYSLVITVWSIVMLEYWKREESRTALQWGMSDFEAKEQVRPEFLGELKPSYINGELTLQYPVSKFIRRGIISKAVVATFCMLIIGVVASIYVLRFHLERHGNGRYYASTVASILNSIQIVVLNMLYRSVVTFLNNKENHRTDTQYEDSLIIKMFFFSFINNYSSFFFIAFIASNLARPDTVNSDYVGECGATNCMEPLSINLGIIFGVRLVVNNVIDYFEPYYQWKSTTSSETDGVEDLNTLSYPEKQYYLVPYDHVRGSLDNFADTAIQFGYQVLFVTALPIASFMSLLNNQVKLKIFSYTIFSFFQRPIPRGGQDIGTWLSIFQFLSAAAVITNSALICFTMSVLWHYSLAGRLWIFIGFQWVLFTCQFMASEFIDDVPTEVAIQLQRRDFINDKVIELIADEDYGVVDNHRDDDGDDEEETRHLHDLKPFPIFLFPIDPNEKWPNPLIKSALVANHGDDDPDGKFLKNPINQS